MHMAATPEINISDAESHVMEVLWRAPAPIVAEQVVVALFEAHHWQTATVKTLLKRLLDKGAVAGQKDGRRIRYRAVLQREDWLARESDAMLARLFGGRVAPLVAHAGRRGRLTQADVRELRALVEAYESE